MYCARSSFAIWMLAKENVALKGMPVLRWNLRR
jgi:hypothetical protein